MAQAIQRMSAEARGRVNMFGMEDRYQILDVVARGAMATVWRARDVRLDRIVAIKRPHTPDARPEFGAAARAVAGVTHPNLLTILDAGTDDTGPYLVMEFVDGPTLSEMGGAPDGAAALGSEIASGLSALHAAGIVHRNVRPSNIMLGQTGSKLTSFGTARTLDSANPSSGATTRFEAPEVLAGGEPDRAADVYALGAVLSWLADQGSPDPDLAPIIGQATSEEPGTRPTAATLAEQLHRIAPIPLTTVESAPPISNAPDGDDGTRVFETTPVPSETSEPDSEPTPPNRWRTIAAVLGVLLVLLVVAVATLPGDEEDLAATDTTTVDATIDETAPSPPASSQETPSPETTQPEETGGVFNTVRIFVTFIRETPRDVLTNSGAEEIISEVADGVSEAIRGNAEEAQSNLADAVDTVQEEIESDSIIDRAIELITRLARQLGLDVEQVVEPSE